MITAAKNFHYVASPNNVNLCEAALRYAARGFPVFPCKPDKTPYTAHGFKDAATDSATIKELWRQWPDALIGMPTGKTSGIAVLDLDVKNGKNGFDAVPDWKQRTPVIARTPSGGAHPYFHAISDTKSTASKIAPGVDTRGEGGYVIVPPSPGYSWIKGELDDAALLPPWP